MQIFRAHWAKLSLIHAERQINQAGRLTGRWLPVILLAMVFLLPSAVVLCKVERQEVRCWVPAGSCSRPPSKKVMLLGNAAEPKRKIGNGFIDMACVCVQLHWTLQWNKHFKPVWQPWTCLWHLGLCEFNLLILTSKAESFLTIRGESRSVRSGTTYH